MSKNKEIWDTKDNAEAYEQYVRNFAMYQGTSKDLIETADIQPGMTVVDLAAGTGATTQAILDKTGGDVSVIAIDQAEEMLNKAKEKFRNKHVRFIVSQAENLHESIKGKVDAVVSNSAFWQMDPRATFQSVSRILRPAGILAFNLPDQFFNHPDFDNKYKKSARYGLDDLIAWAQEAGFSLSSQSVKTYAQTADGIIAFFDIPVMRRNFKTEEERQKRIAHIKSLPKGAVLTGQWAYFVFVKEAE